MVTSAVTSVAQEARILSQPDEALTPRQIAMIGGLMGLLTFLEYDLPEGTPYCWTTPEYELRKRVPYFLTRKSVLSTVDKMMETARKQIEHGWWDRYSLECDMFGLPHETLSDPFNDDTPFTREEKNINRFIEDIGIVVAIRNIATGKTATEINWDEIDRLLKQTGFTKAFGDHPWNQWDWDLARLLADAINTVGESVELIYHLRDNNKNRASEQHLGIIRLHKTRKRQKKKHNSQSIKTDTTTFTSSAHAVTSFSNTL